MSFQALVSRKLDNDYVQVDINATNRPARYFKVKKNDIDEFCATYKKYNQNRETVPFFFMTLCAPLVAFATSLLTKGMKNKFARMLTTILAGVVGGTGASVLADNICVKKQDKYMQQHGITEIYYDDKKSIV